MLELALVFLKIGLASYGGGWTIVGIIKTEVLGRNWLDEAAFADLVAIAQITPGPVALNTATMTGFRVHGFLGAVVATLAVVAVPLILAIVVGMLAKKHFAAGSRLSEALKSATLGLLAMTVWAFAPSMASAWYVPVLSVLAFCLSMFTKLNPVWIILGAGCMGALVFTFL